MKKLLIILLIFYTNTLLAQSGYYNFTLPSSARVSVGVYGKVDSILKRTLITDSNMTAGTKTIFWDGKDDYGAPVTGAVDIKYLQNNVAYNWDGVIGNTSSVNVGTGVHRGYYTSMTGMCFANGFAYFCQGYSEAYSAIAKFAIGNPQTRLDIYGSSVAANSFAGNKTTMVTDYIATDGVHVYYAGYDNYNNGVAGSLVHAITVGTDANYSFGANGSAYTINFGKPMAYTSVIDKLGGAISHPTGLAVQQSGSYLYVAHSRLNQLKVFDKLTGVLVQTLTYTSPRNIAIEGSNLWMVTGTNTIAKYTMQSGGTLSSPTLTLSGVSVPGEIGVSAAGTISVIDSTNQVVRFFNTTTGVEGTQLGVNGGYATSPDVSNTKFMFNSFVGQISSSFVAYAPDGSFWMGDNGNARELHFTAAKSYIETIMSMGTTYSVCADPNNIRRVFGNYLEFDINYSQPLTGSTGWTLVKNWGYGRNNITNLNSTRKLLNVMTLSNGRTYGFDYNTGSNLVELTSTGLRKTSSIIGNGVMNTDGSLTKFSGQYNIGSTVTYTKYPLASFDGSGNPVWSITGTILATTPSNTIKLPDNFPGNVSPVSYNFVTTSGKTIWYNPSKYLGGQLTQVYDGYHLGAIKLGQNSWFWLNQLANSISYTGSFPKTNIFEIGNGVNQNAGSNVNVVGNHIITWYHGEFWKNGQTNYGNHYWEDGLSIGQFGADFFQFTNNKNVYPTPQIGFSGNALAVTLVKNNAFDTMWLYHGDESYHAGVVRWSINNLSSVSEGYATANTPPANILPIANAGANQTITLPANSVTVNSTGSNDPDGTITSYLWTQLSGIAANIQSPNSGITNITGLSQGANQFRLTVTDNSGATASDDVQITVNAAVVITPTRKTIPSGGGQIYWTNGTNGVTLNPGDTGCITAGTYSLISIQGLHGTLANPVVIINCGGQVVTSNTSYGFRFVRSQFFKVTGTGYPSIFYGFQAKSPSVYGGAGMNAGDSVSDYEIDHFESIDNENGAILKTNPDTSRATWRGNWETNNIKLHDWHIKHCNGEAIYGGNTDAYTVIVRPGKPDTIVLPIIQRNWDVYNIIIDSSGWDGIQLASCENCSIHNNRITNYGFRNISSQQAGAILGGRSYGYFYNNYIANGTGEGFEFYGYGGGINFKTLIYNNIFINVGQDGTLNGQDGISVDTRGDQGASYTNQVAYVINNTIVNAGRNAINFPNSWPGFGGQGYRANNNLLVKPNNTSIYDNKYINQGSNVNLDTTKNQRIATIPPAYFVNPNTNDYHLQANSPAIDFGLNASSFGVTVDYDGIARPQGSAYDAGALEYVTGNTKVNPILTWVNQTITYGTDLLVTQNATSGGVAGSFIYNYNGIVNAGTYNSYIVTFIPTDNTTYNTVSKTVILTINKANVSLAQSNLLQTYTGNPLPITVSSNPLGLGIINTTYNGIGTIPVNAGTYTVISGLNNINYNANLITGSYVIQKQSVTLTLSNLNQVYDGNLKPVNAITIPSGISGVIITYNGSLTVPTNAGSYTVVVTLNNINYSAASISGTLIIAKATPNIIWNNPISITYGTALSNTQLNATSTVAGIFVYTPSIGTILNSGIQILSVNFSPTDNTNFNTVNNTTVSLIINKATANLTLGNLSQIYDGNSKSVLVTITPGGLNGITTTYNGGSALPILPGSYTVFSTLNNLNYTAAPVSGTLVINKGNAILSLTGLNQFYSGTSKIVTLITSPVGLVGTNITYNGINTPPINAGTYIVVGSLVNSNYNATSIIDTLKISKISPIVTWGNISNINYGTSLSGTQLNATSSIPGNFVYTPNTGTILNTGTNLLSVDFTPTDNINYLSVNGKSNTVIVDKAIATLSVAGLNQYYDGNSHSVTITTNPINLTGVNVTYNGSSTLPTAVGTYSVVATLTNANYTANSITGTLNIVNSTGAVTITNLSQIYTGSTLPVTVTTNPTGYSTNVTYNGSSTIPTNVGLYTVIATINDGIHVGADTQTYVIKKAIPIITWGSITSITYGTALTGAQLNAIGSVPGGFIYNPLSGTILNSGTQLLSTNFIPTDTSNYLTVNSVNSIIVNKASATLLLSNLNQVYNGLTHAVGISTNPINLGTLSILYNGSLTPPSAVGSYSVIASLTNSNYTASDALGTLVISPATAGILISGLNTIYTGNPLPVIITTNPVGISYSLTYNGSAVVPINTGSYQVIATITDGIHTGIDTQTYTISKATPVLTWNTPNSITYGTALSNIQLNASTNILGNFVYIPDVSTVLNVGNNVLSTNFIPLDTSNYNNISKSVTIVVNSNIATIILSGLNQTYDSLPKSVTVITNPGNLNGITITYNGSSVVPINSGSYNVIVTLTNNNYNASSVQGTLIINRANPILSWNIPSPVFYNSILSAVQLSATSNIPGSFIYNKPIGSVMSTSGLIQLVGTFIPTDTQNYNTNIISVPLIVQGSAVLNYFITHGNTIFTNY